LRAGIDNEIIDAILIASEESRWMFKMPSVTVRQISEETHRALKLRAARHGRSTEAEIRRILDAAVKPEQRVRLGSLLAEIGRNTGGFATDDLRDKSVSEPVSFE
jgi:plasmid stability protein